MESKEKSIVQKKIEELLNVAAVLERLDGIIPQGIYLTAGSGQITCWPDDELTSRKIVGSIIMRLQQKPKIEKAGPAQLQATFKYSDVDILIYNYRGRKCAKIKKTVVHEAEPEKIIPAKAAWVEEVEELVCEMPAVEQEVEAIKEEVTF